MPLPFFHSRARVLSTSAGTEVAMPTTLGPGGGLLTSSAGAGISASANFTPAAAAYSGLDIMDVAKEFTFTFADGSAIPSGSKIRILTSILRIDQTGLQASEAGYNLYLYGITPPTALADNDAWTLASANLAAYRGVAGIGTPVDLGAACFVKTPSLDIDVTLTGTSLFGQLQTIAGFTATAVARQVQLIGVVL